MKILKTIGNFFIKKAIPYAKTLPIRIALGVLDFCDLFSMLVHG